MRRVERPEDVCEPDPHDSGATAGRQRDMPLRLARATAREQEHKHGQGRGPPTHHPCYLSRWKSKTTFTAKRIATSVVSRVRLRSTMCVPPCDAGLGGMGFTPASQGGTHIVERNLTRLTTLVAILFAVNVVLLFHLLK